ncbi:MAG: hypothetical protein WAZ99_10675 [Rectinemataceae bacterium]
MNLPLVALGVLCSAAAQVMLKVASRFEGMETRWILSMLGGAGLYGISFVLYSAVLRKSALSRVAPFMAVAVALVASLAGIFLFGERFDAKRAAGLALGLAALYLLAS